jgi:hypothetical protein
LIHSIESLKALENYMIKYFPIFLETFSFFLVTFDLYYQNKDVDPKTIVKILMVFGSTSMLPFIFWGFALCFYAPMSMSTGNYAIQPYINYAEPIVFNILKYVTFPILLSVLIIGIISTRFKEEKKPRYTAFGCIFFIISKTFSVWLLN